MGELITMTSDTCPRCGSRDVEREPVEVDDRCATQECYCRECELVWLNVYALNNQVVACDQDEPFDL